MRVLPLITQTQLDIKATNMKEFTWNEETIDYLETNLPLGFPKDQTPHDD